MSRTHLVIWLAELNGSLLRSGNNYKGCKLREQPELIAMKAQGK